MGVRGARGTRCGSREAGGQGGKPPFSPRSPRFRQRTGRQRFRPPVRRARGPPRGSRTPLRRFTAAVFPTRTPIRRAGGAVPRFAAPVRRAGGVVIRSFVPFPAAGGAVIWRVVPLPWAGGAVRWSFVPLPWSGGVVIWSLAPLPWAGGVVCPSYVPLPRAVGVVFENAGLLRRFCGAMPRTDIPTSAPSGPLPALCAPKLRIGGAVFDSRDAPDGPEFGVRRHGLRRSDWRAAGRATPLTWIYCPSAVFLGSGEGGVQPQEARRELSRGRVRLGFYEQG